MDVNGAMFDAKLDGFDMEISEDHKHRGFHGIRAAYTKFGL
jgi:hypothetical protein